MNGSTQHGPASGRGAVSHPDADQITAFVEKALPAHEREQMLAHLAVCSHCRETVAMALPPEEVRIPELAGPRPGFRRWRLVWPAAAAAMALFVLYLGHEANLRNRRNQTGQMAALHAPEPAPTEATSSKALQAERSARPVEAKPLEEKTRRRVGQELAAPGQRASRKEPESQAAAPAIGTDQVTSAQGLERAEGTAVQPSSPVAAARPAAGAFREPSVPPVAEPSRKGLVTEGGKALKKIDALRVALTLPSRLPVLSMVAQGSQVLAIDTANAVFLSADQGQHWRNVPVPWPGRAVKAELVAYGGQQGAPGGQVVSFAAANSVSAHRQVAAPVPSNQGLPPPTDQKDSAVMAQDGSTAPPDQTATNQLTGAVTDPTGAPIPGATVQLSGTRDQTTRTAVTDRDGAYLLDGLAAGTYSMETRAPGFAPSRTGQVSVTDAKPNVQNVRLNPGSASETVEVASDPGLVALETQSMTPSGKAPRRQSARSAALAAPSMFEITTDSGEQWTSADGMNWTRK
jgi:Carboxypeptidase regulatory-like domain/Putative zinc-finger